MPILKISPEVFQQEHAATMLDVEGDPHFLVAHRDAVVFLLRDEISIGYALLIFKGDNAEIAELDRLFVIQAERGQGNAVLIVNAIIQELEDRRCTRFEFYSGHFPGTDAEPRQLSLFARIFRLLEENLWTADMEVISVPTKDFVLNGQ